MRRTHPLAFLASGLLIATLACSGVSEIPPASSSGTEASASPTYVDDSTPSTNEFGVRFCLYDPAAPEAAPLLRPPAGTPTPIATPTVPVGGNVDPEGTAEQLDTYGGLWNAVYENYVDPEFNGRDWDEIGDRYQAVIESGITDETFHDLMQAMMMDLGDGHSYYQSREEVEEETRIGAGQADLVGIGTLLQNTSDGAAMVILVFPDSPAAEAGLLPHDSLLAVDGGPVRDENGISRTRGPAGTTVTLTVRTPGQPPRDVTVTRRPVGGGLPIDACLVPGTRIGYLMLPTFLDETIGDRLAQTLTTMNAGGAMDGLVLDFRMNGGGLGSTAQQVLGMFLNGLQGAFVTREAREDLVIEGLDVSGSQTVPLVVLVGPDTVSYGEIAAGVLQHSGRATLVGQPTEGNVEQLRQYDFEDGSRAWIASATFEPIGLPAGTWEDVGILPEVVVRGAWDEFTEANDPGLAAAVEILHPP